MEGSAIIHSLCAGFGDKLPRPRVLLQNPAERSPPHDFSIYLFAALVALRVVAHCHGRPLLGLRFFEQCNNVRDIEEQRCSPSAGVGMVRGRPFVRVLVSLCPAACQFRSIILSGVTVARVG